MQPGNGFEVHSKYSTNYRSRSQQAGNNRHYLHHFIHPQIYVVDVQVLHANHNIAVVFAEIIGLHNMIIDVFKIFGGAVIQQITLTSLIYCLKYPEQEQDFFLRQLILFVTGKFLPVILYRFCELPLLPAILFSLPVFPSPGNNCQQ